MDVMRDRRGISLPEPRTEAGQRLGRGMRTTGGRGQLPWLQEPKFSREDRAGWVMFNTSNWLAERSEQFSAPPGPCGGILGPQQYPPRRIWRSSVRPTGRFDSKSMNRSLNSLFTDEATLGPREGQQLALGHTVPFHSILLRKCQRWLPYIGRA